MDAPPAASERLRTRAPRIRVHVGGHVVIALTLLLGVLAAQTGQNVLALLVALLLAFQLVCGLRSLGGLRGLVLDVEVPSAVDVGSVAHAVVTISRPGRRRSAHGLELEALFGPSGAGEGRGDRSHFGALGGGCATLARLEPGATARVLVPLRGVLRGPAAIVGWRVSSAYPSDLFRRTTRAVGGEATVLVRPASREATWPAPAGEAKAPPVPAARTQRALVRAGEVRGLRGWREGDDVRAVAWRATARQGRLLVREQDAPHHAAVAVVVAARRVEGAARAPILDALLDRADDDAEVAAALLRRAVSERRPGELCVPGRDAPIAVRAPRDLPAALDALAHLAPAGSGLVAPPPSPGRACVVVGDGATPPLPASARVAAPPWVKPAPPRAPRRARVRAGNASGASPDDAAAATADAFEPFRRPLRSVQGAWALAVGAGLLATVDPLSGGPLISAGLASLLLGRRAEPLSVRAPGRAVLLAACVAYAFLPGGDGLRTMARFLSALTVSMLVRRRTPGEDGVVLALLLSMTGLLAALTTSVVAAAGAVAASVLGQRGVGAWHVLRRHERRRRRGGRAAGEERPRATRRSADLAAVATLLVAVPLFVVLPRTDQSFLLLPRRAGSPEPGVPETVRLGGFTGVASGEERVAMAQPLDAAGRRAEPYFRVAAWEAFDGVRWTSHGGERPLHGRYDEATGVLHVPGRDVEGVGPRFRVHAEPAAGSRLPVPEGAARLAFAEPRPERVVLGPGGSLRPERRGDLGRWAFETVGGVPTTSLYDAPTRAHLAPPPSSLAALLRPEVTRALEGVVGREARARRLAAWVSTRARYALDVHLDRADPVADFLTRTRAGHCELFATVLVLALRLDGVPARLVGGFHASLWNGTDDFWVLRRRDAHAWAEAWLEEVGWVRLDGTPAAGRPRDAYEGLLGALSRWRDALRFAWDRQVMGFDAARQRNLATTLRDAAGDGLARLRRAPGWTGAVLAFALAGWFFVRRRRRGGRRGASSADVARGAAPSWSVRRAAQAYREALDSLGRRGWGRHGGETPRAYLARVGARLSPETAAVLAALTEAHERACFAAGDDLDADVAVRLTAGLATGL